MVALFHLTLTSFAYADFTNYNDSYLAFQEAIGSQLDLSDPNHRRHLFNWLNKWGCRLEKKQFPKVSEVIWDWYKEYGGELPRIGKHLMKLKRSDFETIDNAYEVLKQREVYKLKRASGSGIRTIGPTAASKILFALRPNAAVAWDAGMRKELKVSDHYLSYSEFLEKIRTDIVALDGECEKNGFQVKDLSIVFNRRGATVPQLVSEYYWITLNKKVQLPDLDSFKLKIKMRNM